MTISLTHLLLSTGVASSVNMQSPNLIQPTSIPEPQSTLQLTPQQTGVGQQQQRYHALNQDPDAATAQQQQPGNIPQAFSDSTFCT